MEATQLDIQVENLASKIKHYLITTRGITLDEATDEEFYRAFALTLREEIMINWTATLHTMRNRRVRVMHYLCMEYMPGRMLGSNITNMHATELVCRLMKLLGRDLKHLLQMEPDPGLGNGGLGRLAACLLDSLATQQYPAIGYGLRYQYGIFDQEIHAGKQVERPEDWLLHENPWEFRRDSHTETVHFGGRSIPKVNLKGEEVCDVIDTEDVRALAYDIPIIGYKEGGDFNVLTLRLWTTKESPRNFALQRFNAGFLDQASENTALTDVLYPNDNHELGKRIRLKQEFLLASASIQDIVRAHLRHFPDMSQFADKVRIQINDTHPALAILELMKVLLVVHNFSWEEAKETVQTCFSYTNHTILRESLEEWNQHRLQTLFPCHYQILERLNLDLCKEIRSRYPHDEEKVRRMSMIEEGQVRMAHLSIYGSHRVNGVSALHTKILQERVFPDFQELFPSRFLSVTNGVTQRRFLLYINPRLSELITSKIGGKWITDFSQIKNLSSFAQDPEIQRAFLQIKRANKRDLIGYLMEKNPLRDERGHPVGFWPSLGEEALFDVQIKRFHEYKRQLLCVLHLIMIYQEIKENPQARLVNRMVIFAGKAAPGYVTAKQIILLIHCLARKLNQDPDTHHKLKVAFIENYNASRAEIIIPAADLSEQISTAGAEASGTGNMKLAMNGALTIATEDGANIEMKEAVGSQWWPFSFGKTADENSQLNGSYRPWEIYHQDSAIQRAVNALNDHSLVQTEEEHQALSSLYYQLIETDRYLVLSDLKSYFETQKKVEALYAEPQKWAEYAIQNMAGMASFSSDRAIETYASQVWDLNKCPVDLRELNRVRAEYSEHDKCRIFNGLKT